MWCRFELPNWASHLPFAVPDTPPHPSSTRAPPPHLTKPPLSHTLPPNEETPLTTGFPTLAGLGFDLPNWTQLGRSNWHSTFDFAPSPRPSAPLFPPGESRNPCCGGGRGESVVLSGCALTSPLSKRGFPVQFGFLVLPFLLGFECEGLGACQVVRE